MGEATSMLEWIKSLVVDKSKFDKMNFEEREGKFPTGILHQDESKAEYCHAYEEVRRAVKEKRMVDLGALR